MLIWDDAQTYMKRMAQDNSTDALTFLKMMYNTGYKILLAEFGREVIEKDRTIDLTANTRTYRMKPDVQWPRSLEIIDSTTRTPLREVADDKLWSAMKSGNVSGKPEFYHYVPRFGVGGGDIELNPIPSSSDYDLRLLFEATDKDLGQDAYTAGTISLTNNDETVTGAGTTFTDAMVDRYLIPTTVGADALPYRIASRTNNTSLELEVKYSGATTSLLSYKIVEIPNLPQDIQIMPCYFALEQWWSSKGNSGKTKEFSDKWILAMAKAKRNHGGVTRDNTVGHNGLGMPPFPQYPSNFPLVVS